MLKFLRVRVFLYTGVQNQMLTLSDLSVFSYSWLKFSKCLYTISRDGKTERTFVYKIAWLPLSC